MIVSSHRHVKQSAHDQIVGAVRLEGKSGRSVAKRESADGRIRAIRVEFEDSLEHPDRPRTNDRWVRTTDEAGRNERARAERSQEQPGIAEVIHRRRVRIADVKRPIGRDGQSLRRVDVTFVRIEMGNRSGPGLHRRLRYSAAR